MTPDPSLLELIHRYVGYPTAFLVAPLALLAFTRPALHRRFGAIYAGLMTFMYLTGTYRTLTHHAWDSWPVYRNLAFNFFGYSMVLYAWRAITLFTRTGEVGPERLDRILAGLLAGSVAFLTVVALIKDTPMKVFAIIGIILVALEYRDLRAGFQPRQLLFRRHTRYVLLSYFYVLTVVSLVHLKGVFPREVKWLWPSAIGGVVLWLASRRTSGDPRLTPARALRYAVGLTLITGMSLGFYAAGQLARGALDGGQSEQSDLGPLMEPEPQVPSQPGLEQPPP